MKKEKQTNIEKKSSETKTTPTNEVVANEKKEKAPKITKIGAMLKEMRQQKGLKLIDISKKLCIRKCYLEAIEESNYADIPAAPYGNGFIRSYATFLGLNGENIIELYKEETASSKMKGMNLLEPQPEATMPNIQHILISLLAIVLVYIGWIFFNQSAKEEPVEETAQVVEDTDTGNYDDVVVVENFNASQNDEKIDDTNSNNAPVDNQIVVSDEVYQEVKGQASEESNSDEKVDAELEKKENVEPAKPEIPSTGVYIEVLKTTWVEVKDKDRLFLSKVLQPGELYKVPEGEGKILSVGKYDGVNVYINGVLTNVVRPQKKMNIYLDKHINPEL